MACEAVLDLMNRLTGMFDKEVQKQYWATSPKLALIKRGTWPDGIGTTISTQIYGRSAPLVAQPEWSAMTITDGAEGGLCVPQGERVTTGYTTRSYSLARRRLVSDEICAEDMRFNYQVEKQMSAWVDSFGGRIQKEWEMRDDFQYHKNVKYRVVCQTALTKGTNYLDNGPGGTLSADGTNYYPTGGGAPTSQLTWGFLDSFNLKLLRNGAMISALGMDNGSPVLTVSCSKEQANSLKASVDEDLHYGAPSQLLAPYGVRGSLKGYYFLENPYPRRFEYTNNAFVQVPTFALAEGSTKGEEAEINPDWETAFYEESEIFDPTVFTQLIPSPITSVGSGIKFNPVNYTGKYELMNIISKDCNPYGNVVFLDALMACGDEPNRHTRGVTFLHLRCSPDLTPAACNTGQS